MAILLLAGGGLPSGLLTASDQPRKYVTLDVITGMAGFILALRAIGPFTRSLSDDAKLRRDWGSQRQRDFSNAAPPQQVYELLLCVVLADGRASKGERELVRRFLLSRFPDPKTQQQLNQWERQSLRSGDAKALARSIARGLDPGERGTVYSWCCMIALEDREFSPRERETLDRIAAGLGIHKDEARLLFLFAHQMMHGRKQADRRSEHSQQQSSGQSSHSSSRNSTPPLNERQRAFEILDLPSTATEEQIRKRHRELVRRFHPDRHNHLGKVALAEATERFRRIQTAYEVLSR